MTRSCSAALMLLCGWASTANAQIYTSYYHAPPYGTYANYAPAGYNGPLRAFDLRWWAGVAPYSPAYSYAGYDTAYTAAYAPTAYTAGYAPAAYSAGYTTTANYFTPGYLATSYYTPSYESAIAYYPTPLLGSADPCCTPCVGTAVNPSCPSGNCGMNYQPVPANGPQPDPAMGGASGSKTYEEESDAAPGAGATPNIADPMDSGASEPMPPGSDDWRSTEPQPGAATPGADGFPEDAERGANYSPPETIKKKTPADAEDENGTPELPDIEPAPTDPPADEDEPAAEAEIELFKPPVLDPEAAMPLVNRDSRISNAPSVLPERRRLSARFGSPRLARSKVDPEKVPNAKDVKLVRK